MPLLPLALDICVRLLQLKGSKHRVVTSTNPNETPVLSEGKLAARLLPDTKPLTVRA
jgi:hypothetical protein